MRQPDQKQKSQKPPKRASTFYYGLLQLTSRLWSRAKLWNSNGGQALEHRRRGSACAAAILSPGKASACIYRTRSIPSRRDAIAPTPNRRPRPRISGTSSSASEREKQEKHGAPPEQQAAPRRRRAARRRRRGGGRGAADVRAHRVPRVRGDGQRQRVRDQAVHGRRVGVRRPHRGHLLRRRHAHRLPPAVQVHPGQERVQRDDRDDGAGADGGVAQRRAFLRLLLRGQLLRAGQEPGGPAAGGGPARAALGRGQVRRRAPVRGLRGGRGRRRAGRAARRQPAGHQVGRRRQRGPRRGPGGLLRRGAVQLAVRVQRQGQRDMDALRRRQGRLSRQLKPLVSVIGACLCTSSI
ncbi:hypothetical protein PVAP13_5KG038401 [Panicum virgatum]|uniref:Uncharacterized protein n=1 Tax=Panicum virgatum TaxID=38727 RepID=A0A8T0S9T0_PANVG|nr:hypothetical protein PVAP13_5KG038401 [Panicum virgatum]